MRETRRLERVGHGAMATPLRPVSAAAMKRGGTARMTRGRRGVVWALIIVVILGVIGVRMMWGLASDVAAAKPVSAAGHGVGDAGAGGTGAGGAGVEAPGGGDGGINAAAALPGTVSGAHGHATATGGATFTSTADVATINDTGQLVLVNADHGFNGGGASTDVVEVEPTLPVVESGLLLDRTTLDAAASLVAAAAEAGVTGLYINGAYRTRAVQQQLYDQAEDKTYVQTPGHSEHETGLAIDFGVADMATDQTFTDTQAAHWLAANSWRYGFIVRYPDGGQTSTDIAYESWHFRYVGQPHAWYMTAANLTFEQYIAGLRHGGGYSATVEGIDYTVTYETPQDGKIGIPDGGNDSISSDNTGGYIVTQWR